MVFDLESSSKVTLTERTNGGSSFEPKNLVVFSTPAEVGLFGPALDAFPLYLPR